MRTLLEKDEQKLNDLCTKISKRVRRKKPNKESKMLRVDMRVLKSDIEHQIICSKINGKKVSSYDIVSEYLSRNELFVPEAIDLKDDNDYLRVISTGKEPSKSWMRLLNQRDRLLELKRRGYLWLQNYESTRDMRNYFISNGELRYGFRERNDYDARLLGEIVTSAFVMTESEYDAVLKRIKDKKG